MASMILQEPQSLGSRESEAIQSFIENSPESYEVSLHGSRSGPSSPWPRALIMDFQDLAQAILNKDTGHMYRQLFTIREEVNDLRQKEVKEDEKPKSLRLEFRDLHGQFAEAVRKGLFEKCVPDSVKRLQDSESTF